MGMYTELVLKCEIKGNSPEEVKKILRYMFGEGREPEILSNHPFFKTSRWRMIGKCSSFYHHPRAISDCYESDITDSLYIFSRSDLKNYENEIGLFVDWITPYIEGYGEEVCIGWSWYEEDDAPTLIFVRTS